MGKSKEGRRRKRAARLAIWERREEIADTIRQHGLEAWITAEDSFHIRVTNPGASGFVDYWPTTDRWGVRICGPGTPPNSGLGFEGMLDAAKSLPPCAEPTGRRS